MEHPPTDPRDDQDDTLLGDADETNHPSIEEQLDDRLQDEQGDEPA